MALDQLKRDLLVLVPQTNPVLRPIGHEYQDIVGLLARGKRRGVPKRLARLEVTRQQLAARMTEIDDYHELVRSDANEQRQRQFHRLPQSGASIATSRSTASRPALSLRRCIGGPVWRLRAKTK